MIVKGKREKLNLKVKEQGFLNFLRTNTILNGDEGGYHVFQGKTGSQVLDVVTEIGFDVAVTMTDGVSSNMSFFNKKMLENPGDIFSLNRYNIESKIFACYDTTHLFKNLYNNWRNTRSFECPSFESFTGDNMAEDTIFPSFIHLEELYEIEKGQLEKMAYKLNEKVLHPQVMEKTSVKLADSAFHESTINALIYYGNHGYDQFKDSAAYARVIRDWFNTVNVKSMDYGKRQRDERRNPIRRDTVDEDLSYMNKFCEWLECWKSCGTAGLSRQTFEAAIQTCKALTSLVHYLFDRYENLDYVLLGNISSDFLEGRFGWWRQMCGGNYYNSVTQFLQAEKAIHIRSLVSMGYNIREIKDVFSESENCRSLRQQEEIKSFLGELESFELTDDSVLKDGEKSILFYIAGYISKCLAKENCSDCNELFTPGKVSIQISFDDSDNQDDPPLEAKEEFVNAVSRGGLRRPSDIMYVSCVHASSLNRYIFKNEEIKKALLSTENPRSTFIESFVHILKNNENSVDLLTLECVKVHTHSRYIQRIAFTIFNINCKNYVSELNGKIYSSKKRKAPQAKPSKSVRKIKKLQGDGSS